MKLKKYHYQEGEREQEEQLGRQTRFHCFIAFLLGGGVKVRKEKKGKKEKSFGKCLWDGMKM